MADSRGGGCSLPYWPDASQNFRKIVHQNAWFLHKFFQNFIGRGHVQPLSQTLPLTSPPPIPNFWIRHCRKLSVYLQPLCRSSFLRAKAECFARLWHRLGVCLCTVLIQSTSVTDRQTDRQANRQTPRRCQRRAKHSAFARKNRSAVVIMCPAPAVFLVLLVLQFLGVVGSPARQIYEFKFKIKCLRCRSRSVAGRWKYEVVKFCLL